MIKLIGHSKIILFANIFPHERRLLKVFSWKMEEEDAWLKCNPQYIQGIFVVFSKHSYSCQNVAQIVSRHWQTIGLIRLYEVLLWAISPPFPA